MVDSNVEGTAAHRGRTGSCGSSRQLRRLGSRRVRARSGHDLTVERNARRIARHPDQHPRAGAEPDQIGGRRRLSERPPRRHARAYSRNRGASFLPAKPFSQGEHVSVIVDVAGRSSIRLGFSIATLGITQPLLDLPQQQPHKLQHFTTRPDLLAPKIALHKRAGNLPGDIFITPLPSPIVHPESNNAISISPVGPGGPLILDGNGNVVWFRPLPAPDVAANLRIQRYRGRTVLTWWQGGVTPSAFGLGEGVIADHSYRTVVTVHAGNGYPMDLHEFDLTPGGDALFDGLRADPGAPPWHAGGHDLAAAGFDRAGGRHPHRTGRLGVARLRPHPVEGLPRDAAEQLVLRRVSPQLDPAPCGRADTCLRTGHLGAL